MVRPCGDDERGAYSEKNARCGHTGEKKKRAAKPKVEIFVLERYDRDGGERQTGQNVGIRSSPHGRRPRMTGLTMDEEDA